MKGFLVLIVSFYFSLTAVGQQDYADNRLAKIQQRKQTDSIESLIKGTWQASDDSNVVWFFKDNNVCYTFYGKNKKETDIASYRVIDTTIAQKSSYQNKHFFIVMHFNDPMMNAIYWRIIILNDQFMYLLDLRSQHVDFSKMK